MPNLALAETWNSPVEDLTTDRHSRFTTMIIKYTQDMQRFAYWLSGDRHIAEDLVQEASLRAWKSFDRLKDHMAAKPWLLTILRRENARRFERKQLLEADIPLEQLSTREASYDTSTEAFVLRRAINELPHEYREPLVKQVIEGYSQKEIALQMGLSIAGVGSRLFRARNRLRSTVSGD